MGQTLVTGILEEDMGGGVLATALVAAITPRTSGPGRGVGRGGGGRGGVGPVELLAVVVVFCFFSQLQSLSVVASFSSTSLAAAIRKS